MRDIAESVTVVSQHVGHKERFDTLRLEKPGHRVVLGQETPAVDLAIEMELFERVLGNEVELLPRAVHQHPFQVAIGVRDSESTQYFLLETGVTYSFQRTKTTPFGDSADSFL